MWVQRKIMLKTPLRQDQVVSRIMHTQQSMKSFLGGLHKQTPQGMPATALLQIHGPEASSVPGAPGSQAHHHSFQRQVRDAHTWVPCAMCTEAHCSTALHYLHLPSLTKPWIPLCPQCAPAE
jgi:hypothetical protein